MSDNCAGYGDGSSEDEKECGVVRLSTATSYFLREVGIPCVGITDEQARVTCYEATMAKADTHLRTVWTTWNAILIVVEDDSTVQENTLIALVMLITFMTVTGICAQYIRTRCGLTRRQKKVIALVSINIGGSAGCLIFAIVNLVLELTIDAGTAISWCLLVLGAILTLVASVQVTRQVTRIVRDGFVTNKRTGAFVGMMLSGACLFGGLPIAVTLMLAVFSRFSWLLTYLIAAVPLILLSVIFALCTAVWLYFPVPTRLIVLIALLPVVMFLILVSVFFLLIS